MPCWRWVAKCSTKQRQHVNSASQRHRAHSTCADAHGRPLLAARVPLLISLVVRQHQNGSYMKNWHRQSLDPASNGAIHRANSVLKCHGDNYRSVRFALQSLCCRGT